MEGWHRAWAAREVHATGGPWGGGREVWTADDLGAAAKLGPPVDFGGADKLGGR